MRFREYITGEYFGWNQGLKEGGSVVAPEDRKRSYSKAIHLITDRAYMLPVSTYVRVYGTARNLDFTPYSDEMPRFFWSKWK